MKNHTRHTEFILLGLTDDSQLQILIFLFLLLNYTLSMIGNLTIIALTLVDSHLKTQNQWRENDQEARCPRTEYQLMTNCAAHDRCIMQSLANGNIAVVGHSHQKEKFCNSQEYIKK